MPNNNTAAIAARRPARVLAAGATAAGTVAMTLMAGIAGAATAHASAPAVVALVVYSAQGYDSTTYPFVAGMVQHLGGVAAGEKYYQALASNGLHAYLTNGDTLAALEAGIIKVALVQSSAGIGARIKTHGAINTKFLDPVAALPSAIGIDTKAPKAERLEAEKFAEFVLSPQGQKLMQSGDPTGDSLYRAVQLSL